MGQSRAATQAETRERLLGAARIAFATRRFADVTLDEIATAAGFTKGAVYSNFDSKADLLIAVLERRLDEIGADYSGLVDGSPDVDLAAETGRRAARTRDHDLDSFRIVAAAWAEAIADPDIGARYRDVRRTHRRRLATSIRDRAEAVGIDMQQDPDTLAAGLVAMSMATMLEALIDPHLDVETIHATMTEVVLAGVLATAGGPDAPELEVVVRPASASDADDAAVYHRRCWEVAFTHLVTPPGRLMDLSGAVAMLRGWFDPDSAFVARVAEVDGRVIAHVVVSDDEVLHLFVDPALHGRGIGRRLLTVAEGLITEAGHQRGVLQTIVGNAPAIGLYESAGWTVTDELVPLDHDGVQYDEHVLVKVLDV